MRLDVAGDGPLEKLGTWLLSFRVGDFRVDDWGEGHDLVLVFNLLHDATAEEPRR